MENIEAFNNNFKAHSAGIVKFTMRHSVVWRGATDMLKLK